MSIETKAALLATASAFTLLGATFLFSPLLQPATAAPSQKHPTNIVSTAASPALEEEAKRGHSLFVHNCAHCHGDDARGDEGPSLYDLRKTDARITRIIKDGIKGEMPSFGTKLGESDVRALTAYLRTLHG